MQRTDRQQNCHWSQSELNITFFPFFPFPFSSCTYYYPFIFFTLPLEGCHCLCRTKSFALVLKSFPLLSHLIARRNLPSTMRRLRAMNSGRFWCNSTTLRSNNSNSLPALTIPYLTTRASSSLSISCSSVTPSTIAPGRTALVTIPPGPSRTKPPALSIRYIQVLLHSSLWPPSAQHILSFLSLCVFFFLPSTRIKLYISL